MMKALIAGFVIALAGCATPISVGPSPEAQIKTGADTVKAVTVTANKLLANHLITVTQAKSFRNMLVASGESLHDAETDLLACRVATGSAQDTVPDPCWPKVSDVVTIALANIAGVKKALDAK